MSYDLVFWAGFPREEPNVVWARLTDGEVVDGIEPFAFDEVATAFRDVFGSELVIDPETVSIAGRGFELRMSSDPYLYVCCSWSIVKTPEGETVLGQLRQVATALSATVFDPQTAIPPRHTDHPAVMVDLAELGPVREVQHAIEGEDRAQSFGRLETWSVDAREPTEVGAAAQRIHEVYLAQAGDGINRQHALHPTRLFDVACRYARVVQSVLPFEVIVASGEGRARDGTTSQFGNRVLGVDQGKVGFLLPPASTVVREDGQLLDRWTGLFLSSTGPLASRRAEPTDLTAPVTHAATAALAKAHAGDTRPLRNLLAVLVTITQDGYAAEELFAGEAPVGSDYARAFEAYESGAAMPLWTGRNGGCLLEARLRLLDDDRFALTMLVRDHNAPLRPAFRVRPRS